MKRRNFLKTSSAISLASQLPARNLFSESENSIGLQLNTIRKDISDDLEGLIKYVTEIRYKHQELASYSIGKFFGNLKELWKGNIYFNSIYENRKTSGLDHYFVEQDYTPGSVLESIKISFDYLNKADFVR